MPGLSSSPARETKRAQGELAVDAVAVGVEAVLHRGGRGQGGALAAIGQEAVDVAEAVLAQRGAARGEASASQVPWACASGSSRARVQSTLQRPQCWSEV